ncbi:MAG: mercury resistance system transport protein MerF [Burkholderiaceae bacterium]
MNRKRLTTGLVGTALALLCCFSPVLVVLLGALGLSAYVGGISYVVMPLLVFFIGLTIYALFEKQKRNASIPSS